MYGIRLQLLACVYFYNRRERVDVISWFDNHLEWLEVLQKAPLLSHSRTRYFSYSPIVYVYTYIHIWYIVSIIPVIISYMIILIKFIYLSHRYYLTRKFQTYKLTLTPSRRINLLCTSRETQLYVILKWILWYYYKYVSIHNCWLSPKVNRLFGVVNNGALI